MTPSDAVTGERLQRVREEEPDYAMIHRLRLVAGCYGSWRDGIQGFAPLHRNAIQYAATCDHCLWALVRALPSAYPVQKEGGE